MNVDTHTCTHYYTCEYLLTRTTTRYYSLNTNEGQRGDVYVGEIANMDVVAHTCT